MTDIFRSVLIVLCLFCQLAQARGEEDLTALVNNFVAAYKSLKIPMFGYSYEENFANIQSLPDISRQLDLFGTSAQSLQRLDREALSSQYKYLYDHFAYEIRLNLERATLERD